MKKSTLLMIVSVVLAMTLSLGGTLAYLQDSDSDVNVMTLGNVYIEQHEYEREIEAGKYTMVNTDRGESYKLVEFEQNKPLYPAVITGTTSPTADSSKQVYFAQFGEGGKEKNPHYKGAFAPFSNVNNAVDKFVFVENTGKSDAYVRTYIAYEIGNSANAMTGNVGVGEDDDLISTYVNKFWKSTAVGKVTVDNNNYFVYEYLYDGKMYKENGEVDPADVNGRHPDGIVHPGDYTYNSLAQVYMNPHATNEDMIEIDGNKNGLYDIIVLSQAVQAAGFTSAEEALEAGFPCKKADDTYDTAVVAGWFRGSVIAAAPKANEVRPAGYNPLDAGNDNNLVSGITVTDASDKNTNLRALYTGDGKNVVGNLTVKDCYLDGTYAMNVIGDDTGVLTVTDTDLRGWVSYDGFKSATFTNCTFGENTNPEIYNNVRPYSTITFENCAFDDTTFWFDKLPSDATVTFKNCTMNGAALTAKTQLTVVYDAPEGVTINVQ